jgi:hypothetical protein
MNADGHRFHHPDVGIGAGGDSEITEERTEGGRGKRPSAVSFLRSAGDDKGDGATLNEQWRGERLSAFGQTGGGDGRRDEGEQRGRRPGLAPPTDRVGQTEK